MKRMVLNKGLQGFLLFEVFIAVVILSVGIVFSMRAFHHVLVLSQRSIEFFYVERAAEALLLEVQNGLASDAAFPMSGKVPGSDEATYEIKKTRLTMPSERPETEQPEILLPEFKYYLATLTLKKNETVMIEMPFVIKESEGEHAI